MNKEVLKNAMKHSLIGISALIGFVVGLLLVLSLLYVVFQLYGIIPAIILGLIITFIGGTVIDYFDNIGRTK